MEINNVVRTASSNLNSSKVNISKADKNIEFNKTLNNTIKEKTAKVEVNDKSSNSKETIQVTYTKGNSKENINVDNSKGDSIIPEGTELEDKESEDLQSLILLLCGVGLCKKDSINLKELASPEKIDEVIDFIKNSISDKVSLKDILAKLNYIDDESLAGSKGNEKLNELLLQLDKVTSKDSDISGVLKNILALPKEEVAKSFGQFEKKLKTDNIKVKDLVNNVVSEITKKLNMNPEKVITKVVSENKTYNQNENGNFNANDKEDKLLAGLMREKDNGLNKTQRVNMFMSNINVLNDSSVVDAKGETSPIPIINKAAFAEDMIKSVKYMNVNNIKELTVKVMPKELGEVVIRLTMESGVMKANISAANKETYNLIQSNIQNILEKLNDSNIKIQNFTVDIYKGDTTFFKENSEKNNTPFEEKNKNKRNGAIKAIEDETEVSAEEIIDNNINIYA